MAVLPDIVDAYHEAIPLNRYGTEQRRETIFFHRQPLHHLQCISVDGGLRLRWLPALKVSVDLSIHKANKQISSSLFLV